MSPRFSVHLGVERGSGFARLRFLVFVCVALVCSVPESRAQLEAQDGALIDELSKRGMDTLLNRLIEVNPPDDPAERMRIGVAYARLRFNTLRDEFQGAVDVGDGETATALQPQVEEAFAGLLEAQRGLANDPALADRRERAIWKTDLAEMLLADLLRGQRDAAAEFAEFGFVSRRQREALEAAPAEALRLTAEAETLVFDAQRFYGQNPDARQADQASQVYYRLVEDYGQQRIPFYAAMAMHVVATLPDDAPYYRGLGQSTPALPGQRGDAASERQRLLQGAAERLETLLAGDPGPAEWAVRSRLGRVLVAMGRPDDGVDDYLDGVAASGDTGLAGLTAWLGKAAALREAGKHGEALETLDSAAQHELARESPLFRLLVTDAQFITRKARAGDSPDGVNNAYRVYFELLDQLGGDAPAMRAMIYRRWTDALEVGQDVAGLPTPVRMGVGQVARENGQRALFVDEDQDEAQKQLSWAVRVNQTLTGAELPDDVRASGLFNLALSQVLLNQNDVATLIDAVRRWLEVAERYPGQPTAEEAVRYAADYATVLVQQAPEHPATPGLYQDAMDVLFKRYDDTDTAGKHRLFYAFRVFQAQGMHERAAQEYARVPFDHPQYFEAQALRLFNLRRDYELTDADATDPQTGRNQRDAKRRVAAAAAEQLRAEATAARRNAGDAAAEAQARNTASAALLALAAIELDAGQADAALERLDEAERELSEGTAYDQARQQVLSARIVSLVEAGRFNDASAEAQRMMQAYPESAAGVIGGVLSGLEARINTLRAQARDLPGTEAQPRRDEAATLAAVTSTLAKLLVDWADTQGFDPATKLAYDLPYVKSLRLAGRPADALQFLKSRNILDTFGDDLAVLESAGETYYALGVEERREAVSTRYRLKDDAMARAAIPLFDRIITGLRPPYSESYWNAWLRRLALNVALGIEPEKVPLRIRQLEASHPDLGGPAFKARFERLSVDARGG